MENLGKRATDKVTGFTGIIIGKCYYLYGCAQYGINPGVDKEGKLGDINWFDEGRIIIINRGILPKEVKLKENGCENQPHP